jgi:surface antigen
MITVLKSLGWRDGTQPRRRWRRAIALGVLVACLAPCLDAVFVSPASADLGTFLCQAYNYSCAQGGYNATTASQSGWPWAEYGGKWATYLGSDPHNCTLYVAFRLKQNGVPFPGWSADASGWATMAKNPPPGYPAYPVNHVPAVGAVAVWVGMDHVAYVESVSYSTESMVISEDAAGYNYTAERRISFSDTSAMPDYFIHFRDQGQIPGDVNDDGHVNNTDLGVLESEYGHSPLPPRLDGDLDGDGIVSGHDISILLAHWGATAGNQSASAFKAQAAPGAGVEAAAVLSRLAFGNRSGLTSPPSRGAISKPSVQAYTSSVHRGDTGFVELDHVRSQRCSLRLSGIAKQRRRSVRTGWLTGDRVAFTWRTSPTAAGENWNATATCANRSGRTVRLRRVIRVVGQDRSDSSLTSGSVEFVSGARLPKRTLKDRASACAQKDRDSRSGYCPGSAAEYVWSRRPDLARLGPIANWPSATDRLTGARPTVGSVAYWQPGKTVPLGHVAYVEQVLPDAIRVSEADAYAPGVVDDTWLPRTGAVAPGRYIYATARPTTTPPTMTPQPPTSADTSGTAYIWPTAPIGSVGTTLTVAVRLSVGSAHVDQAQTEVSYDPLALAVVSATTPAPGGEGDETWTPTADTATPGQITLSGTAAAATGDHPLALVTFQVLTAGQTAITVAHSGDTLEAVDGGYVDIVPTSTAVTLLPALPAVAQSTLSLRGPTAPVANGAEIDVPVALDVTGGSVSGASITISYPQDITSFEGFEVNGTDWTTTGENSGSDGTVQVAVGAAQPQSGSELFGTLELQAISAGRGTVDVSAGSSVIDSTQSAETLDSDGATSIIVSP